MGYLSSEAWEGGVAIDCQIVRKGSRWALIILAPPWFIKDFLGEVSGSDNKLVVTESNNTMLLIEQERPFLD